MRTSTFTRASVLALGLAACSSTKNDTRSTHANEGSGGSTGGSSESGGSSGGAGAGGGGGSIAFDASGAGGDESDGSKTCAAEAKGAEAAQVNIYVMFDQSDSMTCTIPSGGSRYDAVKTALEGFISSPSASGIGVGIQYFGLDPGGAPASGLNSSCTPADYVKPDVEIAPLPGNAQALTTSLNNHNGISDTPTPAALQGAITHAQAFAAANPSQKVVVVLATDGQPNACGNVQSVAQAAAAGLSGSPSISTYVIGIIASSGTCWLDPAPPNKPDLDTVANAGGTKEAFIVDATQDVSKQFLDAMNAIRGAVALPCEYTIPQPDDGGTVDFHQVNVKYTSGGGQETDLLQANDESQCDPNTGGWHYDDPANPTKILLCAATCATVSHDLSGRVDLLIGCQTHTIPPK